MAIPTSAETTAITENSIPSSLTGQWYGMWHHYILQYGSVFGMEIYQEYNYVIIHIPEAGLFNQPLPASFGTNSITIYAGVYTFTGTVADDSISGSIWYYTSLVGEWQIYREIDEFAIPDPDPGTSCDGLPAMLTIGDAYYLSDLQFLTAP